MKKMHEGIKPYLPILAKMCKFLFEANHLELEVLGKEPAFRLFRRLWPSAAWWSRSGCSPPPASGPTAPSSLSCHSETSTRIFLAEQKKIFDLGAKELLSKMAPWKKSQLRFPTKRTKLKNKPCHSSSVRVDNSVKFWLFFAEPHCIEKLWINGKRKKRNKFHPILQYLLVDH